MKRRTIALTDRDRVAIRTEELVRDFERKREVMHRAVEMYGRREREAILRQVLATGIPVHLTGAKVTLDWNRIPDGATQGRVQLKVVWKKQRATATVDVPVKLEGDALALSLQRSGAREKERLYQQRLKGPRAYFRLMAREELIRKATKE